MDNNTHHTTTLLEYSIPFNQEIDYKQLQKMAFLYNAIQNGWTVQRKKDTYIFTKKHEHKTEIFQEQYLHTFIHTHMNITSILKHE
jgi:hypothetical protein